MRYFADEAVGRTFVISFDPGELILETVRAVVREETVDFAAITCGIGSLDRCYLHVIKSTDLPPGDEFTEIEGPIEVGCLQGLVVNGEVHLHATVYDHATGRVHVGHLEPNCRVLSFMEIYMQTSPSLRLHHAHNPVTKLRTTLAEREA